MTYPFRDPLRTMDTLAAMWASATTSPIAGGSAGAYRTLFMTLRRLVIGRRLNVRLKAGELSLTVTEFDSGLDMRGLSVGQLDDIRLSADELSWDGAQYDHATVVLRNVHLRPATPPVLVAAPVELTVDVPGHVVEQLFSRAAPRLTGRIGDDDVARVRWARFPGLGYVEVDAVVDGSSVALTPRVVSLRHRRWRLPVRTPAYRVALPALPHGVELTDVAVRRGMVRLSGRLPEWRVDVPRGRFEDVVNQLNQRTLNLLNRFRPESEGHS